MQTLTGHHPHMSALTQPASSRRFQASDPGLGGLQKWRFQQAKTSQCDAVSEKQSRLTAGAARGGGPADCGPAREVQDAEHAERRSPGERFKGAAVVQKQGAHLPAGLLGVFSPLSAMQHNRMCLRNAEAFWDGRAILTACWNTWHCFPSGTCYVERKTLPNSNSGLRKASGPCVAECTSSC